MTKWWDTECRCPSGCSALRAPWSVQVRAIPDAGILLGTQGLPGLVQLGGAGIGVMNIVAQRDEVFVLPSCNSGCKRDGRVKLHKVNIAVLFLSKSELVESLCHVNPSCCAAEFYFASFFFLLMWLLGCQGWIHCFIKLQPGKRSRAGRC